jgi:serine O-acetyltransferase
VDRAARIRSAQMDGFGTRPQPRDLLREVRSRHPGLREAVIADIHATLVHRGEHRKLDSPGAAILELLRLIWVSDGFLAQVLYRVKAALQRRGVPVLPRLAHRLALITGQLSIGDPALVQPGLCLLHGQVVIDGFVEIQSGVVISPFVTIGLQPNDIAGPTIERDARIGTGAKVLGPITVGAGAVVGANAVVLDDVPEGATVVGAPARPLAATA